MCIRLHSTRFNINPTDDKKQKSLEYNVKTVPEVKVNETKIQEGGDVFLYHIAKKICLKKKKKDRAYTQIVGLLVRGRHGGLLCFE